jgi:putative ABC transport system ATP-binding protein
MATTEMKNLAIETQRLTKRFHSGAGVVEAVRDVSLRLERGEFVAVMGASGSGKSTLLHLLAGLTRPDEGTIRVMGADIHALSDRGLTYFRRKHIGLIFQAFNLIPSLSGEENIELPMLLGGEAGDPERVNSLIERLGLQQVRKRHPDAMSGGEQQRVAIGRALVRGPSLILADEPTGSLDSANGRRLCDLFRELCAESGSTVLMVTHNPVVAFSAKRFLILRDGQLVGQFDKQDCPSVQELNRVYVDLLENSQSGIAS